MPVDWAEVERALCRVPHVSRAHVVADGEDTVRELHVVATPGKPAKQLVRDVQSVVLAAFGVRVDRQVVSVVQLDEEAPSPDVQPRRTAEQAAPVQPPRTAEQAAPVQPPRQGRRALLSRLTVESHQGECSVAVQLSWAGREVSGTGQRSTTPYGLPRLTAEATLDAVAQLRSEAAGAQVDSVEVWTCGSGDVAVVSVSPVGARSEDVLVGSATVRAAGELDAVARAALDAVNRRLLE